jgi:hypothetical protein
MWKINDSWSSANLTPGKGNAIMTVTITVLFFKQEGHNGPEIAHLYKGPGRGQF